MPRRTAPAYRGVARRAVAAEVARGIGATLIADIDALARRARLRLHSRPVPAVSHHPFHLPAREREVLELVAEGHTDRQIGERLFISHHTVERQVSNILTKVGAVTRAEVTGPRAPHRLVAP